MTRTILASLALLLPVSLLCADPPHVFRTITARTPGHILTGTLRYQRGETVITGHVVMCMTAEGDFVFRFTNAAKATLLELRQDNSYAAIEGKVIGGRWEGPTNSAPSKLRGWLGLSRLFVNQVQSFGRTTTVGDEKFEFRFP
jgi:hypothetical protein